MILSPYKLTTRIFCRNFVFIDFFTLIGSPKYQKKFTYVIKGCKSYDSCFSSIFQIYSQCLLFQNLVYFLLIGYVTLTKKSSPGSRRKLVALHV